MSLNHHNDHCSLNTYIHTQPHRRQSATVVCLPLPVMHRFIVSSRSGRREEDDAAALRSQPPRSSSVRQRREACRVKEERVPSCWWWGSATLDRPRSRALDPPGRPAARLHRPPSTGPADEARRPALDQRCVFQAGGVS